jgi:NADH dehydrogenase
VKVLVTGGTGFVGPHVVHALIRDGHDVRLLVRDPSRASEQRAWGVELVQGDMTDAASLRRAAEGVDTVVHLVAIIVGKPQDFQRIMEQGTRDLVAAARDAGVRKLVLMSALGTSEGTKDLVPYYHAKWEMEQAVKGSTVPHVIFRPSFVFGREGGILPTFARIARIAPVTPIVGDGRQRIQPIWVDDVAEYFAQGVRRDDVAGRTFEIGGPDVVDWNELYDRIKRVLGKRRPSIHIPFGVMRLNAALLSALPGKAPITPDQVKMLADGDNVVSNDDAAQTFGIPLVPLDEQLRRALA